MEFDDLRKHINDDEPKEEIIKAYEKLLKENIKNVEELKEWISSFDKLSNIIEERLRRNYAKFNGYNNDLKIKKTYEYDQQYIMPIINEYKDKINNFIYNSSLKDELDSYYDLMLKIKRNDIEIFRKENIPLSVEENKLANKYYDVTGSMTVIWDGEEKTLPQMSKYLRNENRDVREKAFKLIEERRLQDKEKLDDIFDKLVHIRNEIAKNAGFSNYRDYMFKYLRRFDYNPEDCNEFHEAVRKYVVPLKEKIEKRKAKELGVNSFRPWDEQGVFKGETPLKPCNSTRELINGVTNIFYKLNPFFGDVLNRMDKEKTLDLDSRKFKSPGGFCDYFPESNIPFIFMNSDNSQGDMVTLCHEGGHSVHAMLASHIKVPEYKDTPSEIAELASMSMELLTMEHWKEFYNEEDFKRAKREQLEGIIKFLPWAMVVDKFQHWIYLNPDVTEEERNEEFTKIAKAFVYTYMDWSGLSEELKHRWKKQLHIYEVPFYYIEYAIAQLGALQVYKNYKENKENAIKMYKNGLSEGAEKPLRELYKDTGIKFDFSEDMIKELMDFLWNELEDVYK